MRHQAELKIACRPGRTRRADGELARLTGNHRLLRNEVDEGRPKELSHDHVKRGMIFQVARAGGPNLHGDRIVPGGLPREQPARPLPRCRQPSKSPRAGINCRRCGGTWRQSKV